MKNTTYVATTKIKAPPRVRNFIKRLVKEHPLGAVGAGITSILILVAIFAKYLAPYGPTTIDLNSLLQAPSVHHWMGTDQLGRDVFSRLIFGGRIAAEVGLGATCLAAFLSLVIGVTTGYYGGTWDIIIQRFVDALMAFPSLIFLVTIMSLLGAGILQIIIVLGLLTGITSSRVIRAATIAIKNNMYMGAAKSIGCSQTRVIIRHIIPNTMATTIILFTTNIGGIILSEATLSFLGYGIPPGTPSWGNMLSMQSLSYMRQSPLLTVWPGLALAITVWGINMLGDSLRDMLDPRLNTGGGRYGSRLKIKIAKRI